MRLESMGSRMGVPWSTHRATQPHLVGPHVAQRADDRPVAQSFLDQEHVARPLIKVGREAVAEAVRPETPADSSPFEPDFQATGGVPTPDAAAMEGRECGACPTAAHVRAERAYQSAAEQHPHDAVAL